MHTLLLLVNPLPLSCRRTLRTKKPVREHAQKKNTQGFENHVRFSCANTPPRTLWVPMYLTTQYPYTPTGELFSPKESNLT